LQPQRVDTWDARRVTYSVKMSKDAQFGTFLLVIHKRSKKRIDNYLLYIKEFLKQDLVFDKTIYMHLVKQSQMLVFRKHLHH
jgi:hypothetical protein